MPDSLAADEPRDDALGRDMLRLSLLAAFAGAGIGVVGGAFQWCLIRAGTWMGDLVRWARDTPGPAWLVPVVVTMTAAALARAIVQRVPLAAGSGIQHVEAMWRGEIGRAPLRIVPAKFVGGLLSLASGMVLGREGPTVQMGAVVGTEGARLARLSPSDTAMLQAAVAGAGLGVAFNAPLGGALFTFEELTEEFRLRLAVTTLIACPIAVGCSRLMIGDAIDLPVGRQPTPSLWLIVVFAAFGIATGALGALYNKVVAGALWLDDRSRVRNPVVVAAGVGALVGGAYVLNTDFATGGQALTLQVLDGELVRAGPLLGVLAIRFLAGPVSYATGVPGGLFSPLLAIGAMWGALVYAVIGGLLPAGSSSATMFAVVGMSAFFTGVVRAPLTGIALITEMTGASELITALLAASSAAVLIATVLRSAPIYDTLRLRMLHRTT